MPADVAFGGAFYAIVDSEAAGIPIRPERLDDLRRAGMEIKHAIESILTVAHPEEPLLQRLLRDDLHRARRSPPTPTCGT